MKIALITKILEKTVPPQIIIHLQHKKPTESETLKLVPISMVDSAQNQNASSDNQQRKNI
jgi:hypothetical protein